MALSIVKSPFVGIASRRNLVRNPALRTNATDWTHTAGTGGAGTGARTLLNDSFSYWYVLTYSTAPTAANSAVIITGADALPISGVTNYSARIFGRVSWAGARTRAVIYWINAAGGIISAAFGEESTHAAGVAEWRTISGAQAPAGTVRARLDFMHASGTLPTAGQTLAATGGMLDQGNPIVGNYFDGSIPGASPTFKSSWTGTPDASVSTGFRPTATEQVEPVLMLGYDVARPSNNIVHKVLGADAPIVVIGVTGTKAGQLEVLLADAVEKDRLVALLASGVKFFLSYPELASLEMYFALGDGDIGISLESETREAWIVSFPFVEVAA